MPREAKGRRRSLRKRRSNDRVHTVAATVNQLTKLLHRASEDALRSCRALCDVDAVQLALLHRSECVGSSAYDLTNDVDAPKQII
jgi:hypothetical protein